MEEKKVTTEETKRVEPRMKEEIKEEKMEGGMEGKNSHFDLTDY